MTSPTPLEIAAALRSTAEFVRDPDSPKCNATTARDANGEQCLPTAVEAVEWCAIGRFAYEVADTGGGYSTIERLAGIETQILWRTFDRATHTRNGRIRNRHARRDAFAGAAEILDNAARRIEASIPTAPQPVEQPVEQREAVQA